MRGRFAPSPTGDLHLGNLRTALVAWLSARSQRGGFVVRMEDLDRVTSSPENERSQLAALSAIGIEWDGEVERQSEHHDRHRDAIDELRDMGRVYECFCTRREIRDAISAPHGADASDHYPGMCRELTAAARADRRAAGRAPALRLRADEARISFDDAIAGTFTGAASDVVLQRNDGVPAYNLAVVVDDGHQGITEVVRGDDLLAVTPAQVMIQQLLGIQRPRYAHVPMVLAPDGSRLAKRHGAVTLDDLAARGVNAAAVRSWLAVSLGLAEPGEPLSAAQLVERFDFDRIPRAPWRLSAADLLHR